MHGNKRYNRKSVKEKLGNERRCKTHTKLKRSTIGVMDATARMRLRKLVAFR